MRKVYLDTTQEDMCMSVFVNDAEVILAGTPVNAMPIKHKNNEYQRFTKDYDIHFIFEDTIPEIDFYTIPMVDIFAIDSNGGYIGSVGQATDLQGDIPICYIDADKKCYLLAENGKDFLKKVHKWRENMALCMDMKFFKSFEEAKEKYEFLDRTRLEQELRNIKM